MRFHGPISGSRLRPIRRGFTLIEVLVVISICGLLMALLLPAVQAAREAARRSQCVNNLKQIGLALNSYSSAFTAFPSICAYSHAGTPDYGGFENSPFVQLLPFLEQKPLYDSINFYNVSTVDSSLVGNATAMNTSVGVFLCPSDGPCPVPGYGRTNYRFSQGPSPSVVSVSTRPGSSDGPFTVFAYHNPADFPDGLSQTIGASERIQGDWTAGTFRKGGDYYLTDITDSQDPQIYASPDAAIQLCAGLPSSSAIESRGGESWFLFGYHFATYNHCDTPNSTTPACVFQPGLEGIQVRVIRQGNMPATSYHPGGVNVLLMDGSVRFTRDGIARATWRALSTRTGGEIVPGDF